MAPFHPSTRQTARRRSGGRFLTRLQRRTPNPMSISEDHPSHTGSGHASNPCAEGTNGPWSSLGTFLSCFHLAHRVAKEQPKLTTSHSQTCIGPAEPSPLGSEQNSSRSPQQTSQNVDVQPARHDLVWLRKQLASHDTRASPRSSENEDGDEGEDEGDAKSDYSELILEDDSDAEDAHECVVLAAYNAALNQPVFFFGTCDTGAALSMLSYDKARLVAPNGVRDDFSNVGTRIVHTLGGTVTVHGPIWVTFCLRNTTSRRTRYKAPFYVPPSTDGEGCFDALLNIKLMQRLRLVEFRRDSAAEGEARR